MDEWDVPLEETGEFDQQNDEGIIPGGRGLEGRAEPGRVPDRRPDGPHPRRPDDAGLRGSARASRQPPIVRRLTIMGTHKHGLPTSLDDEVLVGLIQLTKRRSNFTDARVQFSRYELIELLGWPQSGQSYRRIEEALHRWVGVVLMYENAWWDNAAKSWVDEKFHVLDNVTLYDRERWRTSARSGKAGQGGPRRVEGRQAPPALVELPLERGDLPELPERQPQAARPGVLPQAPAADDQADVPVPGQAVLPPLAARLRPADPGLRAHRHEPSYAPTELKRRLKPALEELEQLGFLEPLGPEERYSYVKRGCWRIIFIRGRRRPPRSRTRRAARAAAQRADRGPQGARGHRQDGPGAGRGASRRPDPDQDRGLRLAVAQRGQAGRQEPGRLPRRLDPLRLPGPGRLSGTGRRGQAAAEEAKRLAAARGQAQRAGQRRGPGPARQGPRGRAPRRLGAAARGRARGDPGRRQGREPRPGPLEEHARAPLPGRPRGPDERDQPPRRSTAALPRRRTAK